MHLQNLFCVILDDGPVHFLLRGEEGGQILSQVHPQQFTHQIQPTFLDTIGSFGRFIRYIVTCAKILQVLKSLKFTNLGDSSMIYTIKL
jgi:hypothetical protein